MERYIELLKRHDWLYAFSDDHRQWSKGNERQKEIDALRRALDPSYDIWNQYAPDYARVIK